jgi:hypothetical protein
MELRPMFLVAVSNKGIFLGTILFKGIEECHSNEHFSADCEPPVFAADMIKHIASCLKRGEVEGEVDGYKWNVQDIESMIWRPS